MQELSPTLLDGRTVSRRLKLRAGQLHQLVSSGRVALLGDGRYDVEQVRRAVYGELSQSSQSQHELDVEDTEHEDSNAFALRMMREQAQSAQHHAEKMFSMATSALQQAADALRLENDALRAREKQNHETIISQQDRHIKNLEAHELVLSKAHEREMANELVKAANARKQQGVDMLKQALPIVLNGVKATFEQKSLIREFVNEFEPEQLEAILQIDFFKPKQKALLARLVAAVQQSQAKPTPSNPSAVDDAQTHGVNAA